MNDKGFTVVTYVDDLITRGTREETNKFYKLLNERFDCKESTELNPNNALSFLGFDIKCKDVNPELVTSSNKQTTQQGKVRIISIDQEECVNQFLEQCGDVPTIKNIHSPMANKHQILVNDTPLDGEGVHKYQSIIGVLNYYAWNLRYDIAFATSRLSQFNNGPTVAAMNGLYRILSYIKATSDFKTIGLFGPKHDELKYFSDSDHAGDLPITTCSHSGTMLLLNGVPIRWKSKKQPKTSRSSAEAEIYALGQTVDETNFLNWKLQDIGVTVEMPTQVYVDNSQAKAFTEHLCINTRLRSTFNLNQQWIKELRDSKLLKVNKVESIKNPADLLTKPLPAYKHIQLLKLCNPITKQIVIPPEWKEGGSEGGEDKDASQENVY